MSTWRPPILWFILKPDIPLATRAPLTALSGRVFDPLLPFIAVAIEFDEGGGAFRPLAHCSVRRLTSTQDSVSTLPPRPNSGYKTSITLFGLLASPFSSSPGSQTSSDAVCRSPCACVDVVF
jgi:hypothetical protein